MKLTRRDALLALAGGSTGGFTLSAARRAGRRDHADAQETLAPAEVDSLVAVADVVYPSTVTATAAFADGYASGLGPARTRQLREALESLDAAAQSLYGSRFGALTTAERRHLLRELGVDAVQPRPRGTAAARIRYHVVNGLLFALFTSPVGARLVGIESPRGHSGGFAPYRQRGGSDE